MLSSNTATAAGDNCTDTFLDGGAIAALGNSVVTLADRSLLVGNR